MNKQVKTLLLSIIIVLSSCGDFEDLNIDPKKPQVADENFLFISGLQLISDWIGDTNFNNIGRIWSQYYSEVTYTNFSRYQISDQQIPDIMWYLYNRGLIDTQEAGELTETQEANPGIRANKLAQVDILMVLAFQLLVDLFGDVPYEEALTAGENATPKYDNSQAIYRDLILKINNAINTMDENSTGFNSASDALFFGDIAAWKKFANSLKLRIGIRLADIDSETARQLIEEAAPNAFTSNSDDASFTYLDDVNNRHPLYETLVASGRKDYVPCKTMVDIMNDLDDPRRPLFFTLDVPTGSEFIGLQYGRKEASKWNDYSQIADQFKVPTLPGDLLTYVEVAFILAEAAERGWNVGGIAEEWYNSAITSSIIRWGGTQDMATTYLNNPKVAYTTAEGGDHMKAIATQKWISSYNNGQQGWIEWRRFDWPDLVPPEDMTPEDIPVRYIYPILEPSLNGENYNAASEAMGGDTFFVKVFWDVN